MVAPTPVSALLHAVAVVKVGEVLHRPRDAGRVWRRHHSRAEPGVARLRLTSCRSRSVVASNHRAEKDNLKARLADSTVSQGSPEILLGVALLTPTAIQGG